MNEKNRRASDVMNKEMFLKGCRKSKRTMPNRMVIKEKVNNWPVNQISVPARSIIIAI